VKRGRKRVKRRSDGNDDDAKGADDKAEQVQDPGTFKYFEGGKKRGITMPRLSRLSTVLSSAFSEFVIPEEDASDDFFDASARDVAPKQNPAQKRERFKKAKKASPARSESIAPNLKTDDPYDAFNSLLSGDRTASIESLPLGAQVACVAMFSKDEGSRLAAVERSAQDIDMLSIICQEARFADSSRSALSKLVAMCDGLQSPRALSIIASKSMDREKRMAAVMRLKDVSALLDVAYGARFEDSRWAAINMLREMGIEIDESDLKHDDTLVGSMQRLIKSSVKEDEIVEEMGTLLDNVKHLESLEKGGKHQEFRSVLSDNISSYKSMIQNIAISSRYPQARDLALKGLSQSPESLMEIAQHAEYEETADMAIASLSAKMDKLKESKARALVASLAKEEVKRARALERIDEEKWLRHIVRHTDFEDVRAAAASRLAMRIDKLEEPESLRIVLAYCPDARKREQAEKRMGELHSKARSLPQKKRKVIEDIKKDEDPFGASLDPNDPWAAAPSERASPISDRRKGRGLIGMLKELIGL